ncbi:MAG: hypothetical protein WKH97_07705 [Casimicrobiaceae bacterium]
MRTATPEKVRTSPLCTTTRIPKSRQLRALAIGMMHGMAGSAALILLSVGAAHSPAAGLLYIALFIGSIAGMALLSVAIAVPLRLSAGHFARLHNGMTALAGGLTCALGAFIVYHIGFVEGLLRG